MDTVLYPITLLVGLAVVVTKWFDCTTTLKKIKGIQMESNPIARFLMHKFGIWATVWFAFVVSILVTAFNLSLVHLWTTHILWDITYIVYGGVVATIQGATALNNHQGRPNAVIRVFVVVVNRISATLSKRGKRLS